MDDATNLRILQDRIRCALLIVHDALESSRNMGVRYEVTDALHELQAHTDHTISAISDYLHTEIRK